MESTLIIPAHSYAYQGVEAQIAVLPSVMVPSGYTKLIARNLVHYSADRALDLGCGSGLLGVLIAQYGARRVLAVDISAAAVRCARMNSKLNSVESRVAPLLGDMFAPLKQESFDLVVFNPPSFPALSANGLLPNFYAGELGRLFIDRFIEEAPSFTRRCGCLLLAHNSLTNLDHSIRKIKENLLSCEIRDQAEITFREEYYTQIAHLKNLRKRGFSRFEEREGKFYQMVYLLEIR